MASVLRWKTLQLLTAQSGASAYSMLEWGILLDSLLELFQMLNTAQGHIGDDTTNIQVCPWLEQNSAGGS